MIEVKNSYFQKIIPDYQGTDIGGSEWMTS